MALALGPILLGAPGCATIVKGTTQTITIHTKPRDAQVRYYGRPVPEGRLFSLEKRLGPPSVVYRSSQGEYKVPLVYDVDPLLVVDCLLLLVGVIPGLIAISVDMSTGAWRDLHVHQHLDLTPYDRAPFDDASFEGDFEKSP